MLQSRDVRESILVAEDDESLRRVVEYNLREAGYSVEAVRDGREALEAIARSAPDLVLSDLRMPGATGLDLLRAVRKRHPETEVILITAHGTVDDAVSAMKQGAFDFVTKPVRWDELRLTVARALERRRLRLETGRLRRELKDRAGVRPLLGDSPAMRALRETIHRVASSHASVLIVGESGTGKELVARALHAESARAAKPFVAVNCGALPRDLVESELFGVRRGAFTGADQDRPGRFLEAHGGTLLLDEVAELEPELQVKLLRALQEGEVAPVGGTSVAVDVRVVAATNRPIKPALESGRLRSDLYYRLAVVTIEIPPLRERPEDLEPLVRHLLAVLGASEVELTATAWARLRASRWPGNVRQLENALERALLLRAHPDRVDAADLPSDDDSPLASHGGSATLAEAHGSTATVGLPPEGVDIYALERRLIEEALDRAEGNQTKAATLLGMTRQTLIYRMQKYGIRR
ncbi:MAG: sigma-54 dependent transcriptional regulator [Candidatus Eisenbacteria bacterium]